MPERHSQIVKRVFSKASSAFEDARTQPSILSGSLSVCSRIAKDLLLDVAPGTGHATRSSATRKPAENGAGVD
jgi:hypothetical protein